MKSVAILLVAWFVTGPPGVLPAMAGLDEKAIHRAMEQQRKAAEAEMKRQAEAERKMVEMQKRAMQEQLKAERKYAEMQQKAMHEQHAQANHPQKGKSVAHVAPAHITTTQTTTPVYHAARPYYGHSYGHAYHRTHRIYRTASYHSQTDPQTRAFQRLKASLEHVRMGSPVTTAETTAIKKALMGVVNVPRVPTITSIQSLASNLAQGMANRGSSSAQTSAMAFTLMEAMNSTELANNELIEVMNEHRSALKNSRVRTTEITPIMESLKVVANQERSTRR